MQVCLFFTCSLLGLGNVNLHITSWCELDYQSFLLYYFPCTSWHSLMLYPPFTIKKQQHKLSGLTFYRGVHLCAFCEKSRGQSWVLSGLNPQDPSLEQASHIYTHHIGCLLLRLTDNHGIAEPAFPGGCLIMTALTQQPVILLHRNVLFTQRHENLLRWRTTASGLILRIYWQHIESF